MKKILIFTTALVLLTSCFGDQKNSLSYTLQANFDYNLEAPSIKETFKDSLFIGFKDEKDPKAIGWQDLAFCYHEDAERAIDGGFVVSYSRDFLPYAKIGAETTFPKYWSVYEDKYYKEPEKKPDTKADETPGQKPAENKVMPPHGFLIFHANPQQEQMPKHDIVFINTDLGTCTMVGCLINNTAQNVALMKNVLQKGQYVKVIAKGIREEKETGKSEILIAEFNEERNFVLQTWTKFDLAPLGDVDYVDFEWVTNCPEIEPNFCLDLVTAAIALSY